MRSQYTGDIMIIFFLILALQSTDKIYDFVYSENIKWYTLSYTEKEMEEYERFFKRDNQTNSNEYATLAKDGVGGDIDSFIDTGSYSFNALLSGSIYGGMLSNRTAIAVRGGTGKTFFALGVVKSFFRFKQRRRCYLL